MAKRAVLVSQVCSYIPVSDELTKTLDRIQDIWGFKVLSVFETVVNKAPKYSDQGFIIIYDDKEDNKNDD